MPAPEAEPDKAAPKKAAPKKAAVVARPPTVTDVVRRAIEARGSAYAAARAAGIDPSQVTRFMRGDRGLALDTLDRLCESLGLELKETRRGRPAKG